MLTFSSENIIAKVIFLKFPTAFTSAVNAVSEDTAFANCVLRSVPVEVILILGELGQIVTCRINNKAGL